jgi:hypothetical protein
MISSVTEFIKRWHEFNSSEILIDFSMGQNKNTDLLNSLMWSRSELIDFINDNLNAKTLVYDEPWHPHWLGDKVTSATFAMYYRNVEIYVKLSIDESTDKAIALVISFHTPKKPMFSDGGEKL